MDYNLLMKNCGARLTRGDIDLLDQTARSLKPKVLVEIGSAGGCSSVILAQVAKDYGGHLFCIDPKPEGRWWSNIEPYSDQITLIQAYSPWLMLDPVMTIDFLFIDGDHRTRWILVDYHYWSKFVRIGGIIVFHDWNQALPGSDGEQVRRAINLILETDKDKLEIIMQAKGANDRGSIAFRKLAGLV